MSASSSGSITSGARSNGDAGHFKYKIGQVIGKYRVSIVSMFNYTRLMPS